MNTRELIRASASIVYEGSGSFPVVEDLDDADLGSEYLDFERVFLDRVSAALIGEIITQENGVFNFGGWFEIVRLENEHFVKVPYAVKLWFVDGDQVVDGPGFVSGYKGHDLLIFALDRRKIAARPPMRVPDFLGRANGNAEQWFIPERRHNLEFHLIHFNDLKRTYGTVLGENQTSINMDVSGNGLSWSVDPEFLKALWNDVRVGRQVGHELKFGSKWKE